MKFISKQNRNFLNSISMFWNNTTVGYNFLLDKCIFVFTLRTCQLYLFAKCFSLICIVVTEWISQSQSTFDKINMYFVFVVLCYIVCLFNLRIYFCFDWNISTFYCRWNILICQFIDFFSYFRLVLGSYTNQSQYIHISNMYENSKQRSH